MMISRNKDAATLGNQQTYNRIAEKYLAYVQRSPDNRPIYLKKLFDLLPPAYIADGAGVAGADPIRALELGCGPGVPGTQILAKRCQHVTAIDLSQSQLRLAQSHVRDKTVTFVCGDMMDLRFEPASFQIVSALHSLFHLNLEQQRIMIARIVEWLVPGGVMLATFRPEVLDEEQVEFLGGHTYGSSFGVEGTLEVLRDAGLEVVETLIEIEGGDARFLNHWVWARKSEAGE